MSDPQIFAAGLCVTFLFIGGVYVYLRERYLHGRQDDEDE